MRKLVVAAAQMGPNQKADPREAILRRMISMLDRAADAGADIVVFPELALTTFFPRWFHEDRAEADIWFETQMPGPATQALFDRARRRGIAMHLGYAEKTAEGRHFNTSILVDKSGAVIGKYRKVHLPGHVDYDARAHHQHLEKRYFEPGDLGFQAWRALGGVVGMAICNDRRWPETYRVLGLQGVEMVFIGFNTPSVSQHPGKEAADKRMFHHRLSVQAGAYQNASWVVAVAKAGDEDGHHLMGGSVIVNPDGEIVAESVTEGDELLVHACDLDETVFGKTTMFDFGRHRRIEHYGLIASRAAAIPPPDAGERTASHA
jgi:predicted amidohydrolase